jgi:hypothetical protein
MTAEPQPSKPTEQPPTVPGDADPAPRALPTPSPELRRALWTQASELIVDTGYNFRAHLIVGQKRREQAKLLGIPRVVLPVVASAGTAFLALIGLDKVVVVAFGFIGAIVVALEKYFDPIGQANAHSDKGDRLLTLYKDLRSFRNIRLRGAEPLDQLEREYAALLERGNELRESEPRQYPSWAYDQAKAEIAAGQSSYLDDPLWQDPPADLQ